MEIVVHASVTSGNGTLDDLIADINDALAAEGLGGEVDARLAAGKLRFVRTAGNVLGMLALSASNQVAIDELHLTADVREEHVLQGQRLFGGVGFDTLYAYAPTYDSAVESQLIGDELRGGGDGDFLYGNLRREILIGGSGNDYLHGEYLEGPLYARSIDAGRAGGSDRLFGEFGQDQLFGGGGADELFGGPDSDWLEGQDGNEKQRLDISMADAGSFRLGFDGESTATLAFDASPSDVRAALELLPGIGAGNMAVAGGPLPDGPLDIEFIGALAETDVPELLIDATGLDINDTAVLSLRFEQKDQAGNQVFSHGFTIEVANNPLNRTLDDLIDDINTALVSARNGLGLATVFTVAPGGGGDTEVQEIRITNKLLVDDGDDTYSESFGSDWTNVPIDNAELAYQGDARWLAPEDDGSDIAAWQFEGLPRGRYEVLITWPANPANASDAPLRVYDGGERIPFAVIDGSQTTDKFTVNVNQRQKPGGVYFGLRFWNSVGIVDTATGKLRVELNNNADGLDDLLVGAATAFSDTAIDTVEAGRVYAIYGAPRNIQLPIAGFDGSQNRWVMGHRDDGGWHVDTEFAEFLDNGNVVNLDLQPTVSVTRAELTLVRDVGGLPAGRRVVFDYRDMLNAGEIRLLKEGLVGIATRGPSVITDRDGREGANEIQTLDLSTATGGTFTLTFDGETTSAIAYDSDGAAIQAALEALDNLYPGDALVVVGPLADSPVRLEFTGYRAGNDVPQVEIDASAVRTMTSRRSVPTPGRMAS